MSRRVDFVADFLDAVEEPPHTKRAVAPTGRVDDLALDITRVLLSHAPSGRVSEGELAVLTHATVDEVHAAVDVLERSEIAETTQSDGETVVQMRLGPVSHSPDRDVSDGPDHGDRAPSDRDR
jgi:hypothetical protein